MQRAKRARSRTVKAGSGHSKGIPLRIPTASHPPSHTLNFSTGQHEVLRSGVAHLFFPFFFWALWAPYQSSHGAPLDDPGSLWIATALGSCPAVSGRPQQHAYRGGSVRWCGRPRRCVSGRAVQQGCSAPYVRAGWSGCGRVWSAAAIGRLCGSGRSSEAAVRRTFRLLPPLLLVAARWVGALAGCSDSGI